MLAEVVEAGDAAPPAQLVAWGWPSENSETRQRVLMLVPPASGAGVLEVVEVVEIMTGVMDEEEVVKEMEEVVLVVRGIG